VCVCVCACVCVYRNSRLARDVAVGTAREELTPPSPRLSGGADTTSSSPNPNWCQVPSQQTGGARWMVVCQSGLSCLLLHTSEGAVGYLWA
jgi:hypothetical protein